MTDRIDTDAKPSDLRAWLTFHDLDATEARRMALALLDDRETLRAEVDALRSRQVPGAPMEMLRQVREAMEEGGFTPTTDNGWIGTVVDVVRMASAEARASRLAEQLAIAVEALDVYLADDDNDTIPPDVAGRALARIAALDPTTEAGDDGE